MKASLFFMLTVFAAVAQAQTAAPAPTAPVAGAVNQPIRPMPVQPGQPGAGVPGPATGAPAPATMMGQRPPTGMNGAQPMPMRQAAGVSGGQPMPSAYPGVTNEAPAAGNSVMAPPNRYVPRNPLRPAARPPAGPSGANPAMGNVPPGMPYQNRPAGMNGFPAGTIQQPIPGIPVPGEVEEQDPVKATGKRIGKLNGQDIFKLEGAYFFDKPTPKKKQK